LQVADLEGSPRAILFGAAVHNTTLRSDYYQICADYAGFAQTLLQEKYPGVQAMFMLGCAGDADPYPFGNIELARQHGTALGEEVCRVLKSAKPLRSVQGPLQIAFTNAELPLQQGLSQDDLQKLAAEKRNARSWGAAQMMALLKRGEKLPTHYSCPISVWQFGGDLTLVGLSGEVVVDYVTLLEQALGPNQLWVSAYCHDVFGYLPSAHVLAEGGYETRGLYAGGVGFFTPDAQDVVVKTVRELAKKAGRNVPE
jgi:neutral ceramidase